MNYEELFKKYKQEAINILKEYDLEWTDDYLLYDEHSFPPSRLNDITGEWDSVDIEPKDIEEFTILIGRLLMLYDIINK